MRQKTERHQGAADRTIKDIRRKTRKRYSAEEKIRIVLAGCDRPSMTIANLPVQIEAAQALHQSTRLLRPPSSMALIRKPGSPMS